jgi:DNA-binding transcriptional LysR family regulator
MSSGKPDYQHGLRGISLESLRMFLIAYEEGNLTRAAERSHIALSAFTKRIQTLEHALRAPLFERHARGIVATSAGDEFAYHVRDILKRLNFASQTIGEFATGVRGRIRISATPSAIVGGLAEDISHFLQEHPQVEIELKESDSWSVVPDVDNGHADLGLNMSVMDVPPGMQALAYRLIHLVAIVGRKHPLAVETSVTFEQLAEYEHISLGRRSTLRNYCIKRAEENGRQFSYRPVSSFEVMRSMVAAGLGVGLMPAIMVKSPQEDPKVQVIPISEDWAKRPIHVFFREDTLVPASRLFRDYLLSRESS